MDDLNPRIDIVSLFISINSEEICELQNICNKNNIKLNRLKIRGPQQSILETIHSIVFSKEMILAITSGIISAGVYEIIKTLIIKIIKKNHTLSDNNKKFSCINLKSESAILEIKKTDFSDETVSDAIDAFVKVSKKNFSEHPIPKCVVVIEDTIEILEQNEFVIKYLMKKDTEEKDNG